MLFFLNILGVFCCCSCFVFCLFFLFWFGFAHKDKCSVTGLLVLCTEGKTFTSVLLKDYEVHETSCNKNVRTKGHCNRLQVAHKTLLTLKVQGTLNVFKLLILNTKVQIFLEVDDTSWWEYVYIMSSIIPVLEHVRTILTSWMQEKSWNHLLQILKVHTN